MTEAEIKTLVGRLQKYCGTLAPPIARGLTYEAHRALAVLSDQLEANAALIALLRASLRKVEDEVEALKHDNASMLDSLTRESVARCEAEDMLRRIPTTPEMMIQFIGSHFNSMEAPGWTDGLPSEPTGDLSMVRYSLTVHDLLSVFDWADLGKDSIDATLANEREGS